MHERPTVRDGIIGAVTALVELDREALSGFAAQARFETTRWPVELSDVPVSAEVTDIALGLVALVGDQPVAETMLRLSTRFVADATITLFTADDEALSASIVFDQQTRRMRLNVTFSPAGKSAASAADEAHFLQQLGSADAMALRLPDGRLTNDRIQLPEFLKVDSSLLRLLDLLSDVSRLSRTDVPVPIEVDEELINDLLVARRLLQGQSVEGTWSTGEVRLRLEARELVEEILKTERHQFLTVAEMFLDIEGTTLPLGEIRQVFSDAVISSYEEKGDELVLRLRAAEDKAPSIMSPVAVQDTRLEPNLGISDESFEELLSALDAPPRRHPLRDQL